METPRYIIRGHSVRHRVCHRVRCRVRHRVRYRGACGHELTTDLCQPKPRHFAQKNASFCYQRNASFRNQETRRSATEKRVDSRRERRSTNPSKPPFFAFLRLKGSRFCDRKLAFLRLEARVFAIGSSRFCDWKLALLQSKARVFAIGSSRFCD